MTPYAGKRRNVFSVEPEVLTVSDIPDTKGEAPHFFAGDYRKNNLEMLVDLFALAKANVLHVTPATHGTLSGFSPLAQLLNDNPRILHGLFASPAEARAE